jgi:hypothetical protein
MWAQPYGKQVGIQEIVIYFTYAKFYGQLKQMICLLVQDSWLIFDYVVKPNEQQHPMSKSTTKV